MAPFWIVRGRLHLLEHGLSPDENVAAWQHPLTPIHNSHLPGPKAPSYRYEVIAGRA